ncbi:MAG: Demethylmenaquinone methyltransferase-like protein, partial [uncultured Craurococcus sp.]
GPRRRHPRQAGADHHRHHHHGLAEAGPPQHLAARHAALHPGGQGEASCRPRLHPPLRPRPRGPGDARELVLAEIDARRHRGDAGGLHRRRRCDGRHRCRHLRRHPLRPADEARRHRAGDGWRCARRRRRHRHRPAGLLLRRRRAALRRRPHLRQLGGAGGLRRRRRLPGRRDRRRRRRRRLHPRRLRRRGGQHRRGAGAPRGLDRRQGRGRRVAPRPLPAECREQGPLRGREVEV